MPVPRSGDSLGDPTVSAVVTAHDRRQFLPEAVASALASGADEVVVVRNFTGPIEGVEGRYRDVYCPDPETGVKEAVGLETARSEVVGFLDDDDLWEPPKVSEVRRRFGIDPDLVYYCHYQRPVDAQNRPVTAHHQEWSLKAPARFSRWDGQDFEALFREIWPGNNSSTVVRRAWALEWSPMLRTAGWGADSFWLVAALLSGRRVQMDEAQLTRLRLHAANMSQTRGATRDEFRERHAVSMERFSRSWATLTVCAQARAGRDSALTQYLQGKAKAAEFLANLERGKHPRSSAAQVLRRSSGPVERSVTGTALAALLSPALARRLLYSASRKRWTLQ